MRAVGYRTKGPIDAEGALVDVEIERPTPKGRDLLVEVKAVSVNPVDVKIRSWVQPDDGVPKILGWDAAGIVAEVGPDVENVAVGDEVYYAGSLDRPGTNAAFHLVDERIVGRKPRSLDWAEAAALPLTSITGWEALFDRLDAQKPVPGGARAILIVGGAGGVGSITIQLARALTDLTVIATASRPETADWVRAMGAHHVVDHSQPLAAQVAALGIGAPSFVFSTTHSDAHVGEIVELLAPQGRFALIDDPATFDIMPFKHKSISVHWELMFTRPLYGTADLASQAALLDKVAELVDAGTLRTTMTQRLGPIDAATLTGVHKAIENNTTRGKIVVEGFKAD